MSGDISSISADAVPITNHDTIDPVEVVTEPTLARDSEEKNYCKSMENIDINNEDDASEYSVPMAESSDSNDSNGATESVVEYQKRDNKNDTTSENHTRHNQIQNQIIIQNPTGIVHLGPTYNINVGQAFTQVNSNTASGNPDQDQDNPNNHKTQCQYL